MKNVKKILALLVALMILVASMSVAFATEGGTTEGGTTTPTYDYQQKLKITGLENNDVAHFYQLVKWVGDKTPASGDVIVNGWQVLDAYKSVLTADVFRAAFVGTPDDPTPTGITSELAGKLAVAAKNQTSIDVTAANKEAELDNTAEGRGAGLYMAIITPADPDYVYNPVFVSSNFKTGANSQEALTAVSYSDESAVKKSKTELKKEADTKPEDAWDDQNNGNEDFYWTTAAIGDTVEFTVTTTIPGYGNVYEAPFFKLTDKLTDLTLVAGSVKVSGVAAKFTKDETEKDSYKITEGTDNYSILFDSDFLKTIKTPTQITVTYKALIATTAALAINREKNEVSTEYSHNPSDVSDHGFKKDTTQHYTFTIDADGVGGGGSQSGKKTSEIVKIGLDPQGNPIKTTTQTSEITDTESWEGPLSGAKFKLYTDADCTKEYIPKNADGTTGTALNIETGADGRMTIQGLDAGKYWLQESEAPAGYVRDTRKVPIEIIAATEEVELTEYTTDGATWISQTDYDELTDEQKANYKSYTYKTNVLKSYTVKVNGETTATYHFKNNGNEAEIDWVVEPPVEKPFPFTNNQGTELPSTGGIGTTIFTVGGSLLALAAAILLVTKRRMNNND